MKLLLAVVALDAVLVVDLVQNRDIFLLDHIGAAATWNSKR